MSPGKIRPDYVIHFLIKGYIILGALFTDSSISRAIRQLRQRVPQQDPTDKSSFKCGVPYDDVIVAARKEAREIVRRRRQYGQAIRDRTEQPQTAEKYICEQTNLPVTIVHFDVELRENFHKVSTYFRSMINKLIN